MTPHSDDELRHLAAQHRQKLRASAVAQHVAAARGYRTVGTRAQLERLGFSAAQRRVPALLLPVWDVFGEQSNYQLRADEPRVDGGKPVKYELPRGSRMLLDAHPSIREHLGDPATPLWVTEGILKADAAVSVGLCCVALLGVWNWRGTNGLGGTTALGDWEAVHLKGRQVYVAFDSDVMAKREVYAALARLGQFLASRGARVSYVYLPAGPGGVKTGLDDYLAAGHGVDDLLALATPELRQSLGEPSEREVPYAVTDAGTVWRKPTEGGSVPVPLANFGALIAEDVLEDDGLEERRLFVVDATVRGRAHRFSLPAAQFAGMGWVPERLGAGAIVYPGMGLKDHLRCAILLLSGDLPERRVYAHTGWREVDGAWVFLHANGAIGAEGSRPGVEVALNGPLGRIALPDPPDGDDLCAAVAAALALLELLPPDVSLPLFGATWLAPLREMLGEDAPDFVLWLHGPSGGFKSEAVALAMAFYGDFSRQSLPANFSATANAIERFLFDAKDALLVVDDYHPAGDLKEQQAMQQVVNRLLRGVGNRSGRARMRADTTLRAPLVPRALPVVSGERLPEGHSNTARMFPLPVARGAVDPAALTRAQAAKGRYPLAMAGYVRHLAGRMDVLRAELPARFRELRSEAQRADGHRREPGQVAHLLLGLEAFLAFAVEAGAATASEAEERLLHARRVLLAHAREHAAAQAEEAPERLFARLLGDGFAAKRAYLEDGRGGAPPDPLRWGWEVVTRPDRDGGEQESLQHPQRATLVGVLDGEWLLLFPEQAYQFTVGAARAAGRAFPVDQRTLLRRLAEAGLSATGSDGPHRRLTVNAWVGGASRRVLKLRRDAVEEPSPSQDRADRAGWAGPRGDADVDGDDPSGATGQEEATGQDGGCDTPEDHSSLPGLPGLPGDEEGGGQLALDLAEVREWSR